MIDWKRVAELRDEIGAEDFGDVVDLFLDEVESEISELRKGCPQDQLESKLHFLKGSALNLGFRVFSDFCQTGETATATGAFDRIDLPKTFNCFDASKAEFIKGLEALDDG
ncbi:Hpt domain-containing protein [Rhodobacteraceae bacterium KMM 6894]|nr:Hpt domain-containing protein [Rhodobacteraceae bacterium KMM 6894]